MKPLIALLFFAAAAVLFLPLAVGAENASPERPMEAVLISALVLVVVYGLIAFDLIHRTLAAFLGASAVLFISTTVGAFNKNYYLLSFDDAIEAIDFNVVFLLMGMMIIVAIMRRTGVFQWTAYKSYELAKGDLWRLTAILMIVTAVLSAFLDNVTTVLLMIPVTIEIALILRISPWALIFPEIMASNIGGTATLIGDPPNILIGSASGLSFNAFIVNLGPIVLISLLVLLGMMKLFFGKEYKKKRVKNVPELLERLKREYRIEDRKLLNQSLLVLGFVVVLFLLHERLGMEPSIAAMTGAVILLIISRAHIVEMLEEVEWPTLVFFMMLFIIVGAAEKTGLIPAIAEGVRQLSGSNITLAVIIVVWVSGVMSAIVDNIPFTAAMLPVIAYLDQSIPGAETKVLWWALALGADFGGNATIIGASANVVAVGIAERSGYPIRFTDFLRIGAPVALVTMLLSTAYLLLRYTT
jgi:Na+/H+ antiporter NhaD/arsenite permease-like protein